MTSVWLAAMLALAAPLAAGQEASYGVEWEVRQGSVVVTGTQLDSSAEENDVLAGDVVLSVGGVRPSTARQMEALTDGPVGRMAPFRLLQPCGKERLLTLDKRPSSAPFMVRPWFPAPPQEEVLLGLGPVEPTWLRPAPVGPARAEGVILFDGRSAQGVEVAVLHGGRSSASPFVRTDGRGRYSVGVPAGAARFLGFWVRQGPDLRAAVLLTETSEWEALAPDLVPGQRFSLPPIRLGTRMKIVQPAERALLRDTIVEFRWEAVSEAARYRFRLEPADPANPPGPDNRDEEWVVGPRLCCFKVPSDRLLRRHSYFHWSVDAYDGHGLRVGVVDAGQGVFVFRKP